MQKLRSTIRRATHAFLDFNDCLYQVIKIRIGECIRLVKVGSPFAMLELFPYRCTANTRIANPFDMNEW